MLYLLFFDRCLLENMYCLPGKPRFYWWYLKFPAFISRKIPGPGMKGLFLLSAFPVSFSHSFACLSILPSSFGEGQSPLICPLTKEALQLVPSAVLLWDPCHVCSARLGYVSWVVFYFLKVCKHQTSFGSLNLTGKPLSLHAAVSRPNHSARYHDTVSSKEALSTGLSCQLLSMNLFPLVPLLSHFLRLSSICWRVFLSPMYILTPL